MLCSDKYSSISAPCEGLFKDSGSRFLAYAFPISSESEVKPLVDALRKEHHGARHHCYAYRITKVEEGPGGAVLSREGLWRANDDGEPSGTAGRPILGQIDSRGLQDVLVVVVRYFGGILLGVPGLIRAYKGATADALDKAEVIEKTASRCWRFTFGYETMPAVMNALKALGLEISQREYGEACRFELAVPISREKIFIERMNNLGIFDLELKTN